MKSNAPIRRGELNASTLQYYGLGSPDSERLSTLQIIMNIIDWLGSAVSWRSI